MLTKTTARLAVLGAALALALPATALAGGGAPPADPPIVGAPIARTAQAIDHAADAVDAGNGAQAVALLQAARRYLIRSYRGARYLIANAPPPVAVGDSAGPRRFIRLARRAIRARGSLQARASGDNAGGPAFADTPTSVFDVFTSQFNAVTSVANIVPDVKGDLLARAQTTINAAIVLRNRLVTVVHDATPPAPPATDGRAHVSGAPVAAGYGSLMPGLIVLIDAELQQLQAMAQDTTVPQASRDALAKAITADKQIEDKVNQWWPPLPVGD
jgi:hypothetical protein